MDQYFSYSYYYSFNRVSSIIADDESMASQKRIFDFVVNQNLSLVAVLDNENLQSNIVGCLLLDVASKGDPSLPQVNATAVLFASCDSS